MRPWENFSLMVALGAVAGIATGGVPAYASEVATVALILAMTFSLTEVSFSGLSARAETRSFVRALFLNYVVLSGVILLLASMYPDPAVRNGWIVMAAGPSAVAVIPLTATFRGNVRSSLLSTAFLYVAALALYPAMTLAFAGRGVDPTNLAVQVLLQIALPLLASRPLARVAPLAKHRSLFVNASFFVLVLAITGANRQVFVQDASLVAALAVGGFVRTWVLGVGVYIVVARVVRDRAQHVFDTLFATLKNLALAALLAFSLFGAVAALPAIVSLFFEIAWVVAMSRLFR